MWVAGVADSTKAERVLSDWKGDWRPVAQVLVGALDVGPDFDFDPESDDLYWVECEPDAPLARPAWRLVNVSEAEWLDPQTDERGPNPAL